MEEEEERRKNKEGRRRKTKLRVGIMEGREGKKESAPSRVFLVDVWLCGRQEPSNSAACIEQVGVYRLPVQAVPRQPLAAAGLACRLFHHMHCSVECESSGRRWRGAEKARHWKPAVRFWGLLTLLPPNHGRVNALRDHGSP